MERKFQVIKGGLNTPPNTSEMQFVHGYVTDTRYMGVVGLFMHFKVSYLANPEDDTDLYQFFYFETEEYGFEEYASVHGDDQENLNKIEANLFGGLGGRKIPVTEKEGYYLIQTFVEFNNKRGIPLPEKKEEYIYYLSNPIEMSAKERADIQAKICTNIENNFQAIHYFLMRVFGKDFSAAANLTKGSVLMNQFEMLPISTLVMDTLDVHDASGEDVVYLAESLLDCEDYYMIVVSEVTVNSEHQITGFNSRSSMRITQQEAAMKLRKSEYVTIYAAKGGIQRFENLCQDLVLRTVATDMETGMLYMQFCKNNDHVKKRIFRLSDDVEGLFYVNDYGQILAAGYTLPDIMKLEEDLANSKLAPSIVATAKYEFKEPLVIEFMSSGMTDFNEFLDIIRDDK